jgi:hypothetical protein
VFLVVSPRLDARAWVVSPRVDARACIPLRSDHWFGERTGNSGARRHNLLIEYCTQLVFSASIRSASARYVDYMHI